MAPRKYDLSRRRKGVEATRLQILEAVRMLVGGKGDLDDLSMEAVARRAGVSRMTVYYQFHSRAELLDALSDHLASRGGMERMREVFFEPDPERSLRKLVETFVHFWASDRVTLRRLRALGVVFPRSQGAPRDRDAWRRRAVVTLLERAGSAASPGLADLLTTLTSFEVYDSLAVDGRTPPAVADLLSDLAIDLFRRAAGRGTARRPRAGRGAVGAAR